MSLFKRGNVYWSYVWEDGVRHARSTGTSNRRLAEQIDQKHKEEIRLKSAQLPDLKPKMLFAELAGQMPAGMSQKRAICQEAADQSAFAGQTQPAADDLDTTEVLPSWQRGC